MLSFRSLLLVLPLSLSLLLPTGHTQASFDLSSRPPASLTVTASAGDGRSYIIHRQGADSNCDYLALANGIANIGGDGGAAYWQARTLVAQRPRDFKEGFYTLLGPNGSDQPFSLDNLGAAPEAFVGVYEALGYDAAMLATNSGDVDVAFTQQLYDRLAVAPGRSFAHLWITPRAYNAQARQLQVIETGEVVDLLYAYHEVAAMVDPALPGQFVILDGLIGVPITRSIADVANQLRGFNRAIVVSSTQAGLAAHQRTQLAQTNQPYVVPMLGGAYLYAARQLWGPTYATWGAVIGQPFRAAEGPDAPVILLGEFVHYERYGAQDVTLVPLGRRLASELQQAGVIAPGTADVSRGPELVNGIRGWVEATFGSTAAFERAFGAPISAEFWLTREQFQSLVLRGTPYPAADQGTQGIVAVLTERAMLTWTPESGVSLVPLGRVYEARLRASYGL